eukprot:CAMPEP_0170517810 /NCGR_PEP_ID=MMETSP0209-20121228/3668_1 /TAXON_ID=665100 ORGANISM="Litonotus pictus, Strain P1" /NCGR_SAMPLE_ID=MMETSP0209 /ASSEMBLY_ACC=CAM_ASM_000301 /LENGTH=269 /DNA_ID=CAMNT_0010803157 /DNA_START=207 /DNA_END=1016 /DNA_ORIENTATION=+
MNELFLRPDYSYELKCFNDKVFNWTRDYHMIFRNNETWLNTLLIIAGLFMDFSLIAGFLFWGFRFRSWRMAVSLSLTYIVRGLIQEIYVMGHHEEYLFRYPGFLALTVPYYKTHDYFYSGHVSSPLVVGVEFWKNKYRKIGLFCFFISFFESVMMILVRGHYSIDLYAGVIFSLYFCRISEPIAYYLDKYINAGIYDFEKTNEEKGVKELEETKNKQSSVKTDKKKGTKKGKKSKDKEEERSEGRLLSKLMRYYYYNYDDQRQEKIKMN